MKWVLSAPQGQQEIRDNKEKPVKRVLLDRKEEQVSKEELDRQVPKETRY